MADTAKRTTRTFETLTQIGVIVLVIAGVSGLGVLNHAKDEAMRTRLADAVRDGCKRDYYINHTWIYECPWGLRTDDELRRHGR